jgi:hypothetical protein
MKQDEQRQIDALRAQLVEEYAHLGADVVSARFAAVVADFDDAPVRTFVPLLAQRRLRDELGKLAAQA